MYKYLLLLLLLLSQLLVNAQIKGVVVDDKNIPIEFANVTLHILPDSTLITGAVTDNNGMFSLQSNISEKAFLRISMIGYQTRYVPVLNLGQGVIILNDLSQQLDEFVVTAISPSYKMEADGLNAKIENTVYSKLGTANDVLSQLPFLSAKDGSFTVFGRGTPLIYLNNRLLRDNEELKQVKSSDIKEVKIILNPGSQYDASIGAVIRITTTKNIGEGLSGSLFAFIRKRRNFDHYEYLDLNFRKSKLDVFTKISFDKTVNEQNQNDETILYLLEYDFITKQDMKIKSNTNSWETTVGSNYSFSPVHSIGIQYKYNQSPIDNWDFKGNTYHYIDENNDNNYTSFNLTDRKTHRHYVNMYYHIEMKKQTTIHFEGDFVIGGNETGQSSDFKNIITGTNALVESHNKTSYSLYAGKIIIEKSLFNGKISFGGESSYTDNNQSFDMLNNEVSEDLPSIKDKSEQLLIAAFASYEYPWDSFSFNTGLRYENIDFKYYSNNKYSNEQSRIYNNWVPTLSLSYNNGEINMLFSYKTVVRRPNYFNLRSSITYNNPYNYEGGNPSLKPMFTNRLTYMFGWKDLQLEVSYNWIKDNLLFIAEQFKDKPISLFTMINLPNSERLDGYLSYSPKFHFWRPTFSFGLNKQNLKLKNSTFNKPYYSYKWNNIILLPQDYQLTLNMRGNLQGNYELSTSKLGFRTDIKLSKNFFDDKLSFVLSATDILASDLERWSMYTNNVYFDKWNDSDNRGINLQITYKFNTTRNKYKGQGASNEINRL
ncbi:MAG: hypothetical protein PWQ06_2272 [Anaerophaga sp.]|jgi:hypothetical protein|nr:hypothetical protein [Anaerophaga sp.]